MNKSYKNLIFRQFCDFENGKISQNKGNTSLKICFENLFTKPGK